MAITSQKQNSESKSAPKNNSDVKNDEKTTEQSFSSEYKLKLALQTLMSVREASLESIKEGDESMTIYSLKTDKPVPHL